MSIEQRIECESGKLLARITPDGMKFWCDRHKREELFSWGQIDALRRSFLEVRTIVTNHTVIDTNLV